MEGRGGGAETAGWALADKEILGAQMTLQRADPKGRRTATAMRMGLDLLLDGQHTGRYAWTQLHKSERLHASAVMDMTVQREFGLPDGRRSTYLIGDLELSAVFSVSDGEWLIPHPQPGGPHLVLWADDTTGRCGVGLTRVPGGAIGNDAHVFAGDDSIVWIHREVPLPPNALVQLTPPLRDRIFAQVGGQKRVNELFRVALGRRITKTVVATVAQQEDYLKRVRSNGGARSHLQAEGIVILGDSLTHIGLARSLEVTVPGPGEFVSLKLAPANANDPRPTVELAGERWCVWEPGDRVAAAPPV
jgi:hypothetical protein